MSSRYLKPIRIGLTGSIGMGKSTITNQLGRLNIPVFDADQAVHELYAKDGGAVEPIRSSFPTAIQNNAVNRSELMKLILSDATILPQIEKIVHPLVIEKRRQFTLKCTDEERLFIVYDIPLLFEKFEQYQSEIDYIVVVSCDAAIQERRVLSRPNMTKEKFQVILAKQLPDAIKRQRAHYVINTGYDSYVEGKSQLATVLSDILVSKEGERFESWKSRSPSVSTPSRRFDAVVFDLDETLCAVTMPLHNAFEAVVAALKTALPRTYQRFTDETTREFQKEEFGRVLEETMKRVKREEPLVAHDLSEVRARGLERVARDSQEGEDTLQTGIQQCMEAFLRTRSQIDHYLFSDAIPCLQYLKAQELKTAILTNGNCDFYLSSSSSSSSSSLSPRLRDYLDYTLTASEVGCSKPFLISFLASIHQLGNIPPSRILFVGDDYEKDVLGAARVGMKTVYLVRDRQVFDEILNNKEHHYHPSRRNENQIDYLLNDLSPETLKQIIGE